MEQLNTKEKKFVEGFIKKIAIPKPKTKQKILFAMIGLVGSGKSSVAELLAKEIGAVLIQGDAIRVLLRKQKMKYDNVRLMVWAIQMHVLEQGGNVVIDSDCVNPDNRNHLKKIAKDTETELFFIRVFCDFDVMLGRAITATYSKQSIFITASSLWKGKQKGAIVKLREMWRRTPYHYSWDSTQGGKFIKKIIPATYEEIDTTDGKQWKKDSIKIAKRFL